VQIDRNNELVSLMGFIETIEKALGKTAEKNMLPMQDGVSEFITRYREFYKYE